VSLATTTPQLVGSLPSVLSSYNKQDDKKQRQTVVRQNNEKNMKIPKAQRHTLL